MDPAWVTAATALAAAVIGLLAWFGRQAWRILARTTHFLDDYFGQPARDGVPARPGVMARLSRMDERLNGVEQQLSANGGQSMRDAVDRIEKSVEASLGTSLGTVCVNFKPVPRKDGHA